MFNRNIPPYDLFSIVKQENFNIKCLLSQLGSSTNL